MHMTSKKRDKLWDSVTNLNSCNKAYIYSEAMREEYIKTNN